VGAIVAIGVLLATVATARAAATERDAQLARRADAEVSRITTAIERDVVEMERMAVLAPDAATFQRVAPPRMAERDELAASGLAHRDGDRLVMETVTPNATGPLTPGTDLTTVPAFELILDRVLTEADAAAGAPFVADGREMLTVAAPIYDFDAPEATRRSTVTGAIVAAVDARTLLGDSWEGGIRLVAPNGSDVGGHARGSLQKRVVDVRGRSFTLLLDAPPSSTPTSAWIVLGFGLLLAAGLAGFTQVQVTRRRTAEAQAASRSLQLERIADAGARLQQTLDLGELLPAFAVALAADFELEGVTIDLLDADGLLTEAFATGAPADGAAVQLPLRRGWRAVGMLRVVPGRTLDSSDMTSLQALGDLLAVAMSNAQLYEREQINAARLRDLDALKNAFLGTVSHELRTSMTAIMGFGELLSESWDNLDDDRRREMAGRIRRSAGSLRHLVDDLLDFARLEQERLRVNPRSIDLSAIVRSTIEGLTPLLTHHQLELHVDDELPAFADPVAVERILANLVSNAAKYAPRDTTVTITTSAVGDRARLVVADQGPGIPPDERRRIFARFYRLDTPESVRTRGAGIGLAILRDFADRSGADVVVDDAPGGGARFTIDFPTRPFDADAEPALAEAR
jgi:signal transduction histidine kinase